MPSQELKCSSAIPNAKKLAADLYPNLALAAHTYRKTLKIKRAYFGCDPANLFPHAESSLTWVIEICAFCRKKAAFTVEEITPLSASRKSVKVLDITIHADQSAQEDRNFCVFV